jgi:hypothetical protein
MPKATLAMIYIEKYKMSPLLRRFIFSNAKVEKVVKPPQKPVISNNLVCGLSAADFSEAA